MALVLTNARYFVGPADLTAQSNKVEVDWSAEDKDTTNFGSGGKKERIAGLEDVTLNVEGQYQAGDPGYADDEWWNARKVLEAHTIGPNGASRGDVAYLTQAVRLSGKLFGGVGDVAMFTLGASGSAALARGAFLLGAGTTVTTTGSQSGVQNGAVASGQTLYATLHVLSISGTSTPSITVKVQSDDSSGFSSATDQITFAAATAVGSQSGSVAGPITDDWFRVSYTVTGGTPSFLAVVAIGASA